MKKFLLNELLMGVIFFAGALNVGVASAQQCVLKLTTPQAVLPAGKKQTACIKVGIKGFELKSEKERAPLNVALVIDKSGSMSGQKIERAKEAAIQALRRLSPKDIVAVVAFDTEVQVLVPATKLTDIKTIEQKIRALQAGSSTALYGGTQTGAAEVKKFLEKEYVNRVILLSDGQANVGPDSVAALGELGSSLGAKGIAVTTFGLGTGYNEDLMTQLARKSDGNHAFIEEADELADIFRKEFNTALTVVAQEVTCCVTLPEGVRGVRALNRDVSISGQEVRWNWNQVYSNHEQFVLLEVEIPAAENDASREIALASLEYLNMETRATDKLSGKVEVRFSSSPQTVKNSINKPVMEEYLELVGNIENKRAMEMRDKGDVAGAQAAFGRNAAFFEANDAELGGSEKLRRNAEMNRSQSAAASSSMETWSRARKGVVKEQMRNDNQLAY